MILFEFLASLKSDAMDVLKSNPFLGYDSRETFEIKVSQATIKILDQQKLGVGSLAATYFDSLQKSIEPILLETTGSAQSRKYP